ncbi:hypothetical protein HBH56_092960 [Parastagonospora nodorum]|uniref:Uncharacterized protein n=2 Tax=Phaeosphaeria nodorum (strain SN15 / ATCC MYA-4574 / FGSC 10173) TaxID=321614 RepID=A0A7U2I3W2_PHANO|nr:hypothetical protein SNOG_04477 [Parastagonospora nodorum SN15]KAH3914706.1 hypothetical protein HBH56_092960 [Parastagonospora nodorum]EAT88237.1 hypothetical protein SNOG_04477 [Parastagonospora nodorum SN15]KAH3936286.1 hypothetical protein HBH54_027610 [Parastagonospora nodorum]KAH3948385.1 hypothetical protein HBH53_102430 [Parastagonospora nodorum]KAH3956457.1 hypothetical protein HBH51_241140 [Parastagonospora nodorum]
MTYAVCIPHIHYFFSTAVFSPEFLVVQAHVFTTRQTLDSHLSTKSAQSIMDIQKIDTDGEGVSNALTTENLRNSPLLRLPAEIRNDIFAMAIGGHFIRVCSTVQCELCRNNRSVGCAVHCPPDLLSLTATCRQIHAETRPLPFTVNTFCGYARDMARTFDAIFDRTQLESIASLCIMILFSADFKGFRRLSGLEQVTILSKYTFDRLVNPSNAEEILRRKFLREVRKNEAIGYVDLKIIDTESLRDMGLSSPMTLSPG